MGDLKILERYIKQTAPIPPSSIFWQDDAYLCIYDKFPKARYHLLLIPKMLVSQLASVSRKHVDMIKGLKARAEWIVDG